MYPNMKFNDVSQVLNKLKQSKFRAKFRLNESMQNYVRQKGMETIRQHAFDFITSRIASANPNNDGKQTPMKNHPVFIAQHATATCCRGCIEKWHKIKKGLKLTDTEINYIVDLLSAWIKHETDGKNI